MPSDPPPSRDLRGDERKASVLVVEDDQDFAKILIRLVGRVESVQIDLATSAAEAKQKLADRTFDVVAWHPASCSRHRQ